jgi:hypothetical protein
LRRRALRRCELPTDFAPDARFPEKENRRPKFNRGLHEAPDTGSSDFKHFAESALFPKWIFLLININA